MARLTLVVEAVLPVLLIVPQTYVVGVTAGALMHGAFTMLFPKRLLPYGVSCVAGFVLFADPWWAADALTGIEA